MLTLVLLISHTVADFIIQTREMVAEKTSFKLKAYLSHGFVLLITSLPILILLKFNNWTLVTEKIALIMGIHLLIDFAKAKFQRTLKPKNNAKFYTVLFFIVDQALHILIILLVTRGVTLEYSAVNQFFVDHIFINGGISYIALKRVFIVLYIAFSGAYLVPLIFDVIYEKVESYASVLNGILKVGVSSNAYSFIDEVKTGKWIGILERVLMLVFVYLNQITSIGFIIAVKSLARFKMMENKIFSEYYLLGTLFSVTYTFIAYIILENIL